MMILSGFSIELNSCLCCGKDIKDEEMFFSERNGGVLCAECNSEITNAKMHYKLRDFLNILANEAFDYKSDYEEKANEKVCIVCFELLKSYINSHSSKKFHSTDILQEVI